MICPKCGNYVSPGSECSYCNNVKNLEASKEEKTPFRWKIIFISIFIFIVSITFILIFAANDRRYDKQDMQHQLFEDIQGFWMNYDAMMLISFSHDEYIIHGFGTGLEISGSYNLDGDTIILHSNVIEDKTLKMKSAKVKNHIFSYKGVDGPVQEYEEIDLNEVKFLLRTYGE